MTTSDRDYDFIIVGAGSAGCVLANRLSADPTKRVCLVEAGPPDRSALIHMPLGIAALAKNKTLNWAFETEPQANLNGRCLFWPRGKTLGGSSSINAMIYMRGHRSDYDDWQTASADPLWGWQRLLTLFKRLEANQRFGSDEHHGGDGELTVSDLRSVNPLSRAFVDAGSERGIAHNDDFNGAVQDGVGVYQVTQRNGRRWSAASAFLSPVRHRENLDVLTNARVARVLLDRKRSIGVECEVGSSRRQVALKPGGEVLLCGGAINSPQLLMLSGIGDADELRAHGIEPVLDVPAVGKNLQDHLDITVMNAANSRLPIGIAPSFLPRAIAALMAYRRDGRGELTSNIAESGGFVRSAPERDRPNLQFHFLPAFLRDHGRRLTPGYGFTLHVCDLLPKSRGRIGLHSADPLADPLIDPNYLSAPEDLATLLAALKIARDIMMAPALAAHTRKEVLPGAAIQSGAQLIADIRQRAETIYHPVGSCRMGADADAVVDARLCVRGIAGLRVIDASIMPTLPAGNTNAPTMVIAENAADMILGKVGARD